MYALLFVVDAVEWGFIVSESSVCRLSFLEKIAWAVFRLLFTTNIWYESEVFQ